MDWDYFNLEGDVSDRVEFVDEAELDDVDAEYKWFLVDHRAEMVARHERILAGLRLYDPSKHGSKRAREVLTAVFREVGLALRAIELRGPDDAEREELKRAGDVPDEPDRAIVGRA